MRGQIRALHLALKDPRVPRVCKFVILAVVAYALSPIDLIPDVIPILGWLDDIVILPVGIWLAIRLMPKAVWLECQQRAARDTAVLPRSWGAGGVIIALWLVAAGAVLYSLWTLGLGNA